MGTLVIILAIVALVANSTSDEIRFHWDRLFAHWFPVGSKLYKWMCPSVSWKNKYTNSWFTTTLLSGPLVMFTDLWHALKFLVLNSVFGMLLITAIQGNLVFGPIVLATLGFGEILLVILALNVVWGILFETVGGIFGALSDKYIK